MPDNCPICQQDFKIEPGFYIGALWVSFPIVIVLMALLSILLLAVFKMQLELVFRFNYTDITALATNNYQDRAIYLDPYLRASRVSYI